MRATEIYDPKIDALRGISFLIVFIGHFSYGNHNLISAYEFAPFGVVLFFCLSGYLLGRVVLREFHKYNKIKISNFFLRRAFRILPLYAVYLSLIFLLSQYSKLSNGSLFISGREWLHLVTFSYNLMSFDDASSSPLPAVTWSLSIEEQIYLFFPFIVLLLARKKFLYLIIFITVIFCFLVLGQIYIFENRSINRLTGLYLFPVLVGLFSAYFEKAIRDKVVSKWSYSLQILLVFSVLFGIFKYPPDSSLGYVIAVLLLSTTFPLILKISSFAKVGFILKLFSFIGRVSFGCYLYHWIFWNLLQKPGFAFNEATGFTVFGWSIGASSTLIVSWLSYRFIELPFLNFRRRFQAVETS